MIKKNFSKETFWKVSVKVSGILSPMSAASVFYNDCIGSCKKVVGKLSQIKKINKNRVVVLKLQRGTIK